MFSMTATSSTVVPPRQQWHQSRKLRYGIALIAIGIAGYFVLPWLLMPADLRRMQGTWKLVRVVDGDKERVVSDLDKHIVITGNHVLTPDGSSIYFEIQPEQKTLVFYEADSVKVYGVHFHVPIWLRRPKALRNGVPPNTCTYHLGETALVLRNDTREVGNPYEEHLVRVLAPERN